MFFDGLRGGMLTAKEIEKQIKKGNITISDYDKSRLNPNSYNLRLGPVLKVYDRHNETQNNIKLYTEKNSKNIDELKRGIMHKGRFIPYPTYIFEQNKIKSCGSANGGIVTNVTDVCIRKDMGTPLDFKKKTETIEFAIPEEGMILYPGVLYLGSTIENTGTDKYIPGIDGRSSTGRLGMNVHICAGFGDVGFEGTWTLEITVVEPLRIYLDSEVCQIYFFKPCGKINKANLYRGRYYKQDEPTESRMYL